MAGVVVEAADRCEYAWAVRSDRARSAVATAALLTLLGLASASPLTAQRFAVELRAGASVGNYTETGAGLDIVPEPSYGATLEVTMADDAAVYVGVTRSAFGCEEGFCAGRDVSLTSQGLIAGARWMPALPLRPWLRAGVSYQSLRVTSDATAETSDPGVGWDLGLGLEVPLGRSVRLRPGVTYLRHGAATGDGSGHVAVLAADIGLRVGLGR